MAFREYEALFLPHLSKVHYKSDFFQHFIVHSQAENYCDFWYNMSVFIDYL